MQNAEESLARAWDSEREKVHRKMRFRLNSGRTSAVYIRHGLGGDTEGLLKSPQEYKGCTRDVHRANTLPTRWQRAVPALGQGYLGVMNSISRRDTAPGRKAGGGGSG